MFFVPDGLAEACNLLKLKCSFCLREEISLKGVIRFIYHTERFQIHIIMPSRKTLKVLFPYKDFLYKGTRAPTYTGHLVPR